MKDQKAILQTSLVPEPRGDHHAPLSQSAKLLAAFMKAAKDHSGPISETRILCFLP